MKQRILDIMLRAIVIEFLMVLTFSLIQ